MSAPDLTFFQDPNWENVLQQLPPIPLKVGGKNIIITGRQELARLLSEGAMIYDSTFTTQQKIPSFHDEGVTTITTTTNINGQTIETERIVAGDITGTTVY